MAPRREWIAMRLRAPMMSFGGVVLGAVGPTNRWPGHAMVTGLVGNALGWDWTDRDAHQSLQDRIILAVAEMRPGERIVDDQNAHLDAKDKGWTTRGQPEGRPGGGAGTYKSPHRRRRAYLADADYVMMLGLDGDGHPSLDEIAGALRSPARPLFIGRKPCLPSKPILHGIVSGKTAHAALLESIREIRDSDLERDSTWEPEPGAIWPVDDGPDGRRRMDVADLRVWSSGLAAGFSRMTEGRLQ